MCTPLVCCGHGCSQDHRVDLKVNVPGDLKLSISLIFTCKSLNNPTSRYFLFYLIDQEVGERGGNISAGERQFVALLRAVLAKRKIIVFDEATANLDIESESSILDATEKLLAFQTSIVIAHRLETVLNAEKIMVMENGNLIGFDSHNNLLKNNQNYKDLFSAWNLVNDL